MLSRKDIIKLQGPKTLNPPRPRLGDSTGFEVTVNSEPAGSALLTCRETVRIRFGLGFGV